MVTVDHVDGMTVESVLSYACSKKGLSTHDHYLRVKKRGEMNDANSMVPRQSDFIHNYASVSLLVPSCIQYFHFCRLLFAQSPHGILTYCCLCS